MTWTNDSIRHLEAQSLRDFVESCSRYLTGSVLDLGCGLSPYRSIVERVGGDYTGYDSTHYPANVSGEDVGPMHPLKMEPWDAILVTQVLQYVPTPENWLYRVACAIAPGGHLLMTGPTTWPIVEPLDLWRFTPEGVRHLLDRAGLRVVTLGERAPIELGPGLRLPLGWETVAKRV